VDWTAVIGLAVCWGAFAVTWLTGAAYNASRSPAASASRSPFGSAMLIGVVIVWICFRIVPPSAWHPVAVHAGWVRVLGLAILIVSTSFTLWARITLGTMWSAAPMIRQSHELHTNGPYGVTRHPIYTGILGMLVGSMLLLGVGRWLLVVPVFAVLYEVKIHMEERLMLEQFPDDYPRYRARVPQLIPGLRMFRRRPAS
jgi:protein-S-isoprenylcysteine O-methyltransferase Ste14